MDLRAFGLLLALMLVFSAITMAVFAYDKAQAGAKGRRVPEDTMLTLCALGGWPGGLIAMKMARHKTRKRSFQSRLAFAVVIHLVISTLAMIRFGSQPW